MKKRSIPLVLALLALPATVLAALPQGRGRGEPPAQRAEDDLSEFYFQTADWDGDGWIRFTEAEKSLSLDRANFALFDTDRDGGIDATEFGARYRMVVSRGGVFTPPRSKPDAPRPVKKDAKALLLAYDSDLDGMLVESEVGRALQEANIADPSALVVVATLDKDRSSGIDGAELDELSGLLFPETRPTSASRKTLTLDELFDRTAPRDARAASTIGPRRTAGPITVFRRLDYDRSGGIELMDLEELQRPLRSAVRPAAVLATLDTDGDGSISETEFDAAMR
ncbi:MAG: EF-hand domain-containing protein [Planctomycetota bacterium]|nr:EF-hand domain-containing protein [Planctomycetota bacterium]